MTLLGQPVALAWLAVGEAPVSRLAAITPGTKGTRTARTLACDTVTEACLGALDTAFTH